MESPGERIRQIRGEQGLSLSELSRLSGVSKGYLSQIERLPDTRPSATTLFALARALGTSIGALLEDGEVDAEQEDVQRVPASLREFAEDAALPPADVQMLASIHYRGEAPQTKEDWRFLYESIRRSVNR